jgi:hypothetical protein
VIGSRETTQIYMPGQSLGREIMSMDFTVIQAVRQWFGQHGGPPGDRHIFSNAPFVGPSKEYRFACPHVDPGEWGVIQFATVGVDEDSDGDRYDLPENIIRVNGVDLPGGLQPGVSRGEYPTWKTQILLVPQRVLRPDENILFIQSAERPYGFGKRVDSFVIDNVVLFYKTAH